MYISLQELCATQHLPVKYLEFNISAFIDRRVSTAKKNDQMFALRSHCHVTLLCIERHDQVDGIKNKTVCVETHREKVSFKNAY